jgi:hypothetical protein
VLYKEGILQEEEALLCLLILKELLKKDKKFYKTKKKITLVKDLKKQLNKMETTTNMQ